MKGIKKNTKMLGKAMKYRAKFKKLEKELKQMEIPAEAEGGRIRVIVDGKLNLKKLDIDPQLFDKRDAKTIKKGIEAALKKAIAEARQISEQKMTALGREMDISIG